jgi:hypothetical protein
MAGCPFTFHQIKAARDIDAPPTPLLRLCFEEACEWWDAVDDRCIVFSAANAIANKFGTDTITPEPSEPGPGGGGRGIDLGGGGGSGRCDLGGGGSQPEGSGGPGGGPLEYSDVKVSASPGGNAPQSPGGGGFVPHPGYRPSGISTPGEVSSDYLRLERALGEVIGECLLQKDYMKRNPDVRGSLQIIKRDINRILSDAIDTNVDKT